MLILRRHRQLTLLELLVLFTGAAYGMWLLPGGFDAFASRRSDAAPWMTYTVAALGGLSLSGVPLLLIYRLRHGARWRCGALAWFGMGFAWLALAPALSFTRIYYAGLASGPSFGGRISQAFLRWSLPLMGLCLFAICLIGGRSGRRWWACQGAWPDWLGMWLLAAWAAVGAWVMIELYRAL